MTFQWNFVDGSTNETIANPIHFYITTGNYTIMLFVNDSNGDCDTYYITVVVTNLLPIANFTANPTNTKLRNNVFFNFTGFEGDGPAIFEWNFGDGEPISTERDPIHLYRRPGIFTVTLQIKDRNGDVNLLQVVNYIEITYDEEDDFPDIPGYPWLLMISFTILAIIILDWKNRRKFS
jgi:PKD repeat protein